MSIGAKLSMILVLCFASGCTQLRRGIVSLIPISSDKKSSQQAAGPTLAAKELPTDKSNELALKAIATGFNGITAIEFLPGESDRAVVLEKAGNGYLLDLKANKRTQLFDVKVATTSELGLLGFAFHPQFSSNKKFYVHYNPRSDLSRIEEWEWIEDHQKSGVIVSSKANRIILEVDQPYQNHNGGSLAFGPDKMLYIGFGDGGWRGDPENRAQNPKSLLGKMLRIDIDHKSTNPSKPYAIPSDNPFLHDKNFEPEIFAYGLRNPWKYSFDSKGRLIAGDVGQDKWEEITFVDKGVNLGWRIYEASHCYDPSEGCETRAKGVVDPIAEYDHSIGASVTGGYEYLGSSLSTLKGRYVFGDFVTGRIWSIELPAKNPPRPMKGKDLRSHGKWDVLISTFARDAAGEIYLGDFSSGSIYLISNQKP